MPSIIDGWHHDRSRWSPEETTIKDLRTDNAPGADLIHPRLLKELAVQVAYPLAIIFQQSIDQSRVPQQWRTANAIPIIKKGSKRDAANYRPISLTSHNKLCNMNCTNRIKCNYAASIVGSNQDTNQL